MVAALAVLIATAVALVWWGLSKSGEPAAAPAAALEANAAKMLAVFPFSVRGSEELAYLEEGMVDLLSGRLDGIGDTHTTGTPETRRNCEETRKR